VEGLVRLDTGSGAATRIVASPHDPTGLADGYVQALLLDSRGRLWVGTDTGGVHRLDGGDKFRRFCKVPGDPGSLSADRVLALHQDHRGTVWVGTAAGLNAWSETTGAFTRYLVREGLESDAVSGILEDGDGSLWLATDRGLSHLDPERGHFRAYTASDGLLAGHSTPGSCLRGSDGTMYFGGFSGFTAFHPDQVADNPNVPRVVLRSVDAFDGTRFVEHRVRDGATVRLSWRENFFTVRFAALDFTDPDRNRYAYRLEGLDSAWVDAGTRSTASYTNVDPGTYTFLLRGSNNDGVWNMAGTRALIMVVPPFWATWWFRVVGFVALVGALAGALAGGYGWRERRLLAEQHRLEALVAVRTAELAERRDQLEQINDKKNEFLGMAAHDLRSPLGLIQGWTAVAIQQLARGKLEPERGIRDLTRVVRAAEQMNRLVNELLDISAIESGRLRLVRRREDMRAILSDCEQMHSRIAAEKGITLTVQGDGPLPGVFVDRERIQEVVVNLLSNAIKFTAPGGRVTVSCEVLPGEVVTHVEDTGVGLTEADLKVAFKQFGKLSARPTGDEPSTGLGLAIVKKIVELHDGRVWVTSRQGVGSTFSFSVPVAQ
jgi:signal transduction histidine kinase